MRNDSTGGENTVRAIGRVLAILCALVMLTAAIPAAADDNFNLERDGFSTSYTYNYDYWRDVQASPDAYRVAAVIDSVSLGLDNLDNVPIRRPQSLFVKGQDLMSATRAITVSSRSGSAETSTRLNALSVRRTERPRITNTRRITIRKPKPMKARSPKPRTRRKRWAP